MSNSTNQGFSRLIKTRYLLNGNCALKDTPIFGQVPSHKASGRRCLLRVKRSLSLKILLLLAVGFTPNLVLATSVRAQEKIQNTLDAKPQMRDRTPEVALKLPELVQLVVQNNRELKNNSLNRIVAKQELEEAESKFSPTITPNFSVSVDRSLGSSSNFDSIDVEDSTSTLDSDSEQSIVEESFDSDFDDFNDTNFDRNLQIGASLLTPFGTDITLTIDPIAEFDVLGLQIRQPLLRGAGTKVNRVSVQSARLNDTSQMLGRKQSLMDKITEAIKAYRTLIQAQESVKIQRNSLNSRRKDLEAQTALVEAGRRARADLVQQKASVAAAQEQLLSAFNNLAQANSDLLALIDTDRTFKIVVPDESIEALVFEKLLPPAKLNQEALLQKAYARRTDYLQANIDIDVTRLNTIEQKDNLRWQLDATSNINVGDDTRASAALELTQTFGDKSPKTALLSSRINLLQRRNDLEDLKQTIAIEVSDRIRDVNSNFAEVREARQATKLAQERLNIVRELYRRGRDGIDIFEVTSQQDEVVEAQNTELNAVIDYLNAQTDLEQSLGITLDTWQEFIR